MSFTGTETPSAAQSTDQSANHIERRNFGFLTAYLTILRTGWIFKTESIIMPAVLDMLSGSAWIRGLLPLLNRFGQSVPPLLAARRLNMLPRKKTSLVRTTILMTAVFLALSGLWAVVDDKKQPWMVAAYLTLYTLFFIALGINNLAVATLQGKLVSTERRGLLLLVSNTLGAASAVGFALWLLPKWLRPEGGDFAAVFGFSGLCFGISVLMAVALKETPDNYAEPPAKLLQPFRDAWQILKVDANFRRLAILAALSR